MRRGNFSYVIDSSFRPFSMQEMMAPLVMYKEAYEKAENQYVDLQDKANKFKYLSKTLPENSEARQLYEGYANDLKAQAEDLVQNGLSISNKQSLADLRGRYSGEIGMLNNIVDTIQTQIKEQQALKLKDPTRLFSRDVSLLDVDKYLKNPGLSYESYSGALLATQVNQAATSLANELSEYVNGKPLSGNTRTWLKRYGLTPTEVAQAISNPNTLQSSKVLSTIINNVIESSGMLDWADPATLRQAYQYASQGLWGAVGKTDVATYTLPEDKASKAKQTSEQSSEQTSEVPDLVPPDVVIPGKKSQPAANSTQPATKKSKRNNRGYTYAYGGNLYLTGGDEGDGVKISPQLGAMLDQLDDDEYQAFITENVGTPDYSTAQRDSVLQAYDKQLVDAMETSYLNSLFKESLTKVDEQSPMYRSQPVMTTLEYAKTAKDSEMLKKYGKYFYRTENGNYAMNAEGRKLYSSTPYVYNGPFSTAMNRPEQEFKEWVDQNGLSEMAQGRSGKYQTDIFNNIKSRVDRKVDANVATEYYKLMNHVDYPELIATLNHISDSNNEIPNYKRVKRKNSYTFEDSGKKIDVSKLSASDIKSAAMTYGVHGNYVDIVTNKGERILIPYSMIDSKKNEDITANVQYANGLLGLQNSGAKVTYKNEKEVENIENSISRALNAALKNMYSTFTSVKGKADEVTSGTYTSEE